MRSSPHMFRFSAIVVIAAAGIAFSAPSWAQTTAGRALITDNTNYTNATPGCGGANGTGPNVSAALQNAGNYTYTNSYTAAYNMIQAPGSYFACLTSLLSAAQGLLNMFNNMGSLSLSSVLTAIAQAAVASLIQTLANQVCQAVGSMTGSSGIIIPAVGSLLAGVGAAAAAGSAATPAQVTGTVDTSAGAGGSPFDSEMNPNGTITNIDGSTTYPNGTTYSSTAGGYGGGIVPNNTPTTGGSTVPSGSPTGEVTSAATPTYVDPSTVVMGTGTVTTSPNGTVTVTPLPNLTALINSPAPTAGAPVNSVDNNGTTTVNTQTPTSASSGSGGLPTITTNDSDTNDTNSGYQGVGPGP